MSFDPRDDWRDLLLRPHGRIARVTFAWVFTVLAVVWVGIGTAVETSAPSDILRPLWWVLTSPFAFMAGMVTAKRLQDMGITRWGALVLLIPVARWVFAAALAATPGDPARNAHGRPPEGKRRPTLRVIK